MKNKNEKIKKKLSLRNLVLIILISIISLVGIFFLSTYIRWNVEISNKNEILYYGQENIKVTELKDFYGTLVDVNINFDEAMILYCTNLYGGECVTGDFSDTLENLFRKPRIIINIVILADLFLLFIILKNKDISKVKVYLISGFIVLYGIYSIGVEIYNFFDYHKLVNKSEYLVNASVYKGLKTKNNEYFKPVVSYKTDKDSYILYLDYDMKGNIEENINKELILYYDKKDNTIVTPKRNLDIYILPIVIDFFIISFGFMYISFNKKMNESS